MKRFLAALVSLSLIAATTPPAAWAQFSEAASAGAGASASAGAASAAALSGAPRAIGLGVAPLGAPALSAAGLSALSAPSAPLIAPGLRPFELTPHAVQVDVPARAAVPVAAAVAAPASAAASAEAAPAAPSALAAPETAPSAAALAPEKQGPLSAPAADVPDSLRGRLFAAAAELAGPAAHPAEALERLFSGGRAPVLAPGSRPFELDVHAVKATAPRAAAPASASGNLLAESAFGVHPAASPLAEASGPTGPTQSPSVDAGVRSAPPSAPGPDAQNAGGFLRRMWAKATAFTRVLPDASRNRAFWNFTLGQALVTIGFNFHYTALPGLLANGKDNTSKVTENRAIGWSAQAAASLLTGPLVDRQPAKRVIVWAYLGRGVLMALVPVLFLTGHFGFAAFSGLIALAGFLQATTMNAASVAFNRILGDDESYYNRANAISTIVTDAVGVVAPLIAGAFIAYFAAHFPTALLGNAMSYGVYAITLLMAGVGYAFFLKIPRDDSTTLRRGLQAQLKTVDLGGAKIKGVSAGTVNGKPGLIVEVAGVDPAEVKGLPADYQGYPVKAVAARNPMREMIAGFRIAWADKFLRLYLLTTTVSMASGDALTFASLTRYLSDVLHAGAGAFGLFLAASSLGLALSSVLMSFAKDPAQAALAPAAAEFRTGLAARDAALDANALDRAAAALRSSLPEVLERYKTEWQKEPTLARGTETLSADVLAEAATAVGAALKLDPQAASALLESTGASNDVRLWAKTRGAKLLATWQKDAKTGMDSLQRQGRWTAYAQAASWIVYAGMFFAGGLHLSIALMLLSSVLAGASSIVWSSLSTRVIAGNYPQDQGKVYSAMSFYWLACSVVGVLGIGALLTALSTAATIWVTAGVLAACAVFSALQGWRSFPLAAPKR